MKTYQIYMILLVIMAYSACNEKQEYLPVSINITAMVDITDPNNVLPDAESLLSIYDFQNYKNKEAFFRLTTTTDKLLNPAIEIHLAAAEKTEKENQFEDPDFREKEVLAFYESVRSSIASFNIQKRHDSSLGHSECFRTIASELSRMKERKTSKYLLAVYSDLSENSDLYNIYKPVDLQQVFKYPDTVIKRFEETKLLPNDLSGFTVLFIYQSKNREDDKRFNAMAGLFKKLLFARKATVLISADNPKYIQL